MTTSTTNPPQQTLLNEWLRKSRMTRLLLPTDFLSEVNSSTEERLTCHKTVIQYQYMTDRTKTKVVKLAEAHRYSNNLSYRPHDFNRESMVLIDGASEVACNKCRGRGILSCPTRMRCRKCDGSAEIRESCSNCGGSGRVGWNKEWDCLACTDGTRKVRCGECNRGEVVCERCNGRGYIGCNRCDSEGKLVQANFISRKFSSSSLVTYQLSGLSVDQFKNGLSKGHFGSLAGIPIHESEPTPSEPNVVRERKRIFSYGVLSQEYLYKGNSFFVNYITSKEGSKLVASRMPFSAIRVAVSGFMLCGCAVAAISALMLLA